MLYAIGLGALPICPPHPAGAPPATALPAAAPPDEDGAAPPARAGATRVLPTAAALNWVLKDGLGRLGKLMVGLNW